MSEENNWNYGNDEPNVIREILSAWRKVRLMVQQV